MRRLVVAEFKKLLTTRATYLLFAGVVALSLATLQDPATDAGTFAKPFHEQTFVLFTAILTRILILILGIRAVTDEFRHGTIVPTFLVTPRRRRVLAAKAIVVATVGALLGAAAWLTMTGAASALASSEGASLSLGKDALRSMAGMTLGGALWAVTGLGLGALVRSQIIATVGGLVWLMGVEDALRGSLGDLAGYLPGQAGLALATAPDAAAAITGAVTLIAYAGIAVLCAALAIRRDVS